MLHGVSLCRFLARKGALIALMIGCWMAATPALAQYGGRVATVEVSTSKEEVLAITTDVQGRMMSGAEIAITAFTNASSIVEPLKLGDIVKKGQVIARQDAKTLRRRLSLLEIQLSDAKTLLLEIRQDIASDKELLALQTEQVALLAGKVSRARDLAARNALSADAVETALNASLAARQQLANREAAISKKGFQQDKARSTIERITLEITQVREDIAETVITAPAGGQITFLSPLGRSFMRQGEVVARILDPQNFEVEAEIPTAYLNNVAGASVIMANGVNGETVVLQPRATLPIENARTGTRTMRFAIKNKVGTNLLANNAAVILQVPTTDPAPVVTVIKDAVLPVQGGHVVFVAEDGVAMQRRIKLGGAAGDSFIVLDGLESGASVIVRGNEALSDGKKIKIGDAGAAGAKKPKKLEGEPWLLEWNTRRGPASGDLVLGKTSTFNDEEVTIVRAGNSINFIGKLDLPFGIVELDFNGKIDGETMSGEMTMRGLPGGREATVEFTGKKVSK